MSKNVENPLRWFEMSEQHRGQYRAKEGRSVSMLAFCTDDAVIEMGQVAKRSNKSFWWFTTNPTIETKHTAGSTYDKLVDAEEALRQHVVSEIERLKLLSVPVFFHDKKLITSRRSDRRAIGTLGRGTDAKSFMHGMEWALRTSGIPRKPTWAKFIVQNRDKSFTWFENQPVADIETGRWVSPEGQSKRVNLIEDDQWSWNNSIKRIA